MGTTRGVDLGMDCEWIGGLLSPPFYIEDGADAGRVSLVVWMEAPSGLVVGCEAVGSQDCDGAVTRVLLAALQTPLAGPPRRPDRIRVSDVALAEEVRGGIGESIPVVVGPTPELEAYLETMLDAIPDERSYLDGGRVSPAAVARLFTAARLLWTVKPWTTADDSQVLRVDVPALGVDGACVSIIGALGERLGLMIFPGLEAFDAFATAAERARPEAGPIDLSTDCLALNFEREADLSPAMRREVADHSWSISGPDAYPVVDRWERDAVSRPLVERDVELAAACALSLSSFFIKHEALFATDGFAPVCESYVDEHDLEVRLTFPYEAFPAFDLTELEPAAPPFQPQVGRNAPCPCGSGRKYKKCHLPLDEADHAATRSRSPLHDLDGRMVRELTEFAMERFPAAWIRFERDFDDPDAALQLAAPWSVYGFEVDGRTVVEAYLQRRGGRCSTEERTWLEAQQAAWLSVWEVVAVDRGQSLTLRDLLSGETRQVQEASGSRTLVRRDALLARIVEHDGGALLCGSHPRPLPPVDAAEVVRRARGTRTATHSY